MGTETPSSLMGEGQEGSGERVPESPAAEPAPVCVWCVGLSGKNLEMYTGRAGNDQPVFAHGN